MFFCIFSFLSDFPATAQIYITELQIQVWQIAYKLLFSFGNMNMIRTYQQFDVFTCQQFDVFFLEKYNNDSKIYIFW